MKQPVRVAVTGAAGAISYTILFKIAAGELLGKDQPGDPPVGGNSAGNERVEWRRHGTD